MVQKFPSDYINLDGLPDTPQMNRVYAALLQLKHYYQLSYLAACYNEGKEELFYKTLGLVKHDRALTGHPRRIGK